MCLDNLNYYCCKSCHWLVAWSPRPVVLGYPEIGMLQCVPLLRYNDFDLPSTECEKCIEQRKKEDES